MGYGKSIAKFSPRTSCSMDKIKQLPKLGCGNISTSNYSGKPQNWQCFGYFIREKVINIPSISDKNHVFSEKSS